MPASPTHHGSSHPIFFQTHSDHTQIPNQYSIHGTNLPNNNQQNNHNYGSNFCSNSNSSPYHVEIPSSNMVKL